MVIWVPVALLAVVVLLAVATHLEQQRARFAVRLTVRSTRSSPEQCEAIVAAELAPVLTAHGFGR
jgi:hypothetical protein